MIGCTCQDGRWEETEPPTILFEGNRLQTVSFYYICFNCGRCWTENHNVSGNVVVTISNVEDNCW